MNIDQISVALCIDDINENTNQKKPNIINNETEINTDTNINSVDIKNTTSLKKVKVKKKPGRPRKTPLKQPRPRNGIVLNPKDDNNYIEFLYDKPLLFKKIWQYFKLMAVDKIQIIFRKTEIIFWSEDHHKKSKMRFKIDVNNVNHYYCSSDLDIGVFCKNPELIMSTIDKTYNSIIFLSKKQNIQKDIRIILNNDIEIDESHKVELIGDYKKIENEERFTCDNEYQIKFNLPGKYFKKMISDIRTFSDEITIRKDSELDPLIFEYSKGDKKIISYHIVQNTKNIKLVSKLQSNESFRVSFKIDYVKPISSAMLSENITIFAHENKPLLFYINMDKNAIELKILTEIIDNRNKII
jgi:hypothetical protein